MILAQIARGEYGSDQLLDDVEAAMDAGHLPADVDAALDEMVRRQFPWWEIPLEDDGEEFVNVAGQSTRALDMPRRQLSRQGEAA